MRTGKFQQASDIYALGLVLWEIRTSSYPFQQCKNFQTLIQDAILGGYRHEFPLIPMNSTDREVLEEFENLIRDAWSEAPSQRPDINQIVIRLENILLSTCYSSLKLKAKNLLESGTPFSAYPQITNDVRAISRQSVSRESFGGIQSFLPRPLRQTFSRNNSVLASEMPMKLRSNSFLENFNQHGGAWAIVPLDSSSFPIWFRTVAWNNLMAKHSPLMSEHASPRSPSASIRIADVLLEAGYYIPRVGHTEALEITLQSEFPQHFLNFLNSIRKYHYGHVLISNEELSPRIGYNKGSIVHSELSIHAYQVNVIEDSTEKHSVGLSSFDKVDDGVTGSKPILFAAILFQELMAMRNVSQRSSIDHRNSSRNVSSDMIDGMDKPSLASVPMNRNFSGAVQSTNS